MRFSTTAVLLSGLAAQQVVATWNKDAGYFNTPKTNDNECSDKQKGGYDWKDLPQGPAKGYDNFNFGGGWTCANSFGKRDHITKRTFNSKCVKNTVSKSKPASFDCGDKLKKGFSVTEMHVSVEYDCDVEFHYGMPDGSTCKHVVPCKKDGTIVQNTQCGGAKNVNVYLGNHDQKGKDSCEIGIHHVGFDCSPPQTKTPPSPPATSPTKPATQTKPTGGYGGTPPVQSPPASSTPTKPASETKPTGGYGGTPPVQSPPASSTPTKPASETKPTGGYGGTPPVQSAPASSTTTKPAETKPTGGYGGTPPVQSAPASSTTTPEASSKPPTGGYGGTPPVQSAPASSTTTKPAETMPTGGYGGTPPAQSAPASSTATPEVSSKPYANSTAPVAPPTGGYTAPSGNAPTPSGTPPAYTPPSGPDVPAPPVLPKCLNTWLTVQSECKDNTDYTCFCRNPNFTKDVINCVSAWAKDSEVQNALTFLVGICAQFVPQNPGLITNCPSTVTLGPTSKPAVPSTGASAPAPAPTTPAPAIPVTTIVYSSVVTVPCSSAGKEIPGSSIVSTIATSVTVPQIVFSTPSVTQPGAPSAPVNLVPGTPPPVPASLTQAPPVYATSTFAVIPTGSNGTGTATAPSVPLFTGAASAVSFKSAAPALFGAVLAFFAL